MKNNNNEQVIILEVFEDKLSSILKILEDDIPFRLFEICYGYLDSGEKYYIITIYPEDGVSFTEEVSRKISKY